MATDFLSENLPTDAEQVRNGASRIRETRSLVNNFLDAVLDSGSTLESTPTFKSNWVTGAMILNDGSEDANRAVGTNHLKDDAVTAPKLATGAVTADAMAADAVLNASIKNSEITIAKFAPGFNTVSAVTIAKDDRILFSDTSDTGVVKSQTVSALGSTIGDAIRSSFKITRTGAGTPAASVLIGAAITFTWVSTGRWTINFPSTLTSADYLVNIQPLSILWQGVTYPPFAPASVLGVLCVGATTKTSNSVSFMSDVWYPGGAINAREPWDCPFLGTGSTSNVTYDLTITMV
jgi:hypothetical protein